MDLHADNRKHVCIGEKRTKLKHMRLIIKQFALRLCARNRGKLTSTCCIPHTDDESSPDDVACLGDNLVSDFNHSLVNSFRITSDLKRPVLCYVGKTAKHVSPRNSNFIKHEPTVVFGVVSKFRADVTDFNPS